MGYYVKMIAIRLDPFESVIVDEKNFGLTTKDNEDICSFKSHYKEEGCDVQMYYLENPIHIND